MSGYKEKGLAHYYLEGEKNMKRYLPLILALLLVPFTANGSTLLSGSFENGMSPFGGPHYGGAEVVSDSTAPDGTHSLRINIRGDMGGNSPDIIDASWSSQNEIWVQFYIKFSDNYQWPSIQDKFVFLPLQGNNFFIGSQWGNQVCLCTQVDWGQGSTCWGGGGWSKGGWHKVVFHGIANSGTSGVGQVWVDDTLVINANNVNFRQNSGDGAFTGIMLENVFGGPLGVRSGFPKYTWYDSVIVQTTPFGGGVPSPPSKIPAAPSTLIININ